MLSHGEKTKLTKPPPWSERRALTNLFGMAGSALTNDRTGSRRKSKLTSTPTWSERRPLTNICGMAGSALTNGGTCSQRKPRLTSPPTWSERRVLTNTSGVAGGILTNVLLSQHGPEMLVRTPRSDQQCSYTARSDQHHGALLAQQCVGQNARYKKIVGQNAAF